MNKNSLIDFSKFLSHTEVKSVFSKNPEEYTLSTIAASLGIPAGKIASPDQVHSVQVDLVDSPGKYSGMDGLVTQKPDIVLTLKVADCVPVYLYEPLKKMIGLIHSGWRGTTEGIITNTISLMQKQGADVQKILVYLGPAIGICCYDVDSAVADKINVEAKKKIGGNKWKVGLHKQISIQLAAAGIMVANIQTSEICTYESLDCHSYRRDGINAGRMFAFLGLQE